MLSFFKKHLSYPSNKERASKIDDKQDLVMRSQMQAKDKNNATGNNIRCMMKIKF